MFAIITKMIITMIILQTQFGSLVNPSMRLELRLPAGDPGNFYSYFSLIELAHSSCKSNTFLRIYSLFCMIEIGK